ncbi:MAG: Tim44/TimA family putative adaptor protein [Kiloniellales bacterium]|nr:Tim44/TimA family putative adaptor protein [Kiloniellales bacterium]
MGNGFQFFDVILLAAIAGFVILRLRSVLGRRTGHEEPRPRFDPFQQKQEENEEDKVIPLPDRERDERAPGAAKEEPEDFVPPEGATPLETGLTQIKLADREFDPDIFIPGAKAAFEMIILSFAQGDAKTLRPLLSNDVFEDFSGAIKARESAKESLETTLVGIKEAELIEAELQGKTAFLTIKFVSEQVNVTRDAAGEVVDGDPNNVATITDIWTFARNTRSRDPNWTLVATRSSN